MWGNNRTSEGYHTNVASGMIGQSAGFQFCDPNMRRICADVVVVGGGIGGLSTACQLAKLNQKTRIVVLEKEKIGKIKSFFFINFE